MPKHHSDDFKLAIVQQILKGKSVYSLEKEFNLSSRSITGGLRLGEMEIHALISHGSSTFIKERMIDSSDNYRIFSYRTCGLIATVNPDKGLYRCNTCRAQSQFAQVRIPYACKLLFQELEALGIKK